jgi:hypothetical protein
MRDWKFDYGGLILLVFSFLFWVILQMKDKPSNLDEKWLRVEIYVN